MDRSRPPEVVEELKRAAEARRQRRSLRSFIARVFEPRVRPEVTVDRTREMAEWPARVKPAEINPQVKGGARVKLTRLDIASTEAGRSMRSLRRAFQRGERVGRRYAGTIYVGV